LDDLLEAKYIQFFYAENDWEDEQEVQSIEEAPNSGAMLLSKEIDARMENLARVVRLLIVLVVALGALFVGYVLK
jgi:hypothetical protein